MLTFALDTSTQSPSLALTRGERLVEAHLLDFDRDLYGERIRVEVGTLVREQRSFGTEGELVEQIASDVAAIRVVRAESSMSSQLPGAPPN